MHFWLRGSEVEPSICSFNNFLSVTDAAGPGSHFGASDPEGATLKVVLAHLWENPWS